MDSTLPRAYLHPALTALTSAPLICASLDHPLVHLDHCCPPGSFCVNLTTPDLSFLNPSFTRRLISPLFTPTRGSLCVVGQELLQIEGVFLLRLKRVPLATGKVDSRKMLGYLGHVPGICHHLDTGEKTSSSVSTSQPSWVNQRHMYAVIPHQWILADNI